MKSERCLVAVMLFWFVGPCVACQPVPCDAQAARMQAKEPALAITLGKSDVATAKANREVIELALRNGGTVTLPEGFVAVDRGIRLPSGCTLQGAGPRTVIRNVATGAPFGDNCTLVIHPQNRDAGIGYADGFSRGTTKTAITFKDAAVAARYRTGGWLFTYKWNGYTEPGGSRTWVHRVEAERGNTIVLNVAPQPEANAAVYTNAAVRISGALEGRSQVKIAAGVASPEFTPGRWVYITAGPSKGNESCGEMRRIMSITPDGIALDRPLRDTYPYQLSLAVLLNPTENVTVRDLTVQPFNNQAPPCYFKFAANLSLQRVVVDGDIHCGQCQGVRIADCSLAGTVNFNGVRDGLVAGGRCRQVYLEEHCFDCAFASLLVSGSPTAGVNAVAGSPSVRITLQNVIVEGARDMPIHLIGRECVVENCTVRNSNNPVSWVNNYLGGDGTRVNGFTSDLATVVRSGRGVVAANVRTPLFLGWYEPTDQPVGVAVGCPKLDTYFLEPATLAQWTIATPAVE